MYITCKATNEFGLVKLAAKVINAGKYLTYVKKKKQFS